MKIVIGGEIHRSTNVSISISIYIHSGHLASYQYEMLDISMYGLLAENTHRSPIHELTGLN